MHTPSAIQKVRKLNSDKSLVVLENESSMIKWIIIQDLKASSRAITTRQMVHKNCRNKRATRALSLLNYVKHRSSFLVIKFCCMLTGS